MVDVCLGGSDALLPDWLGQLVYSDCFVGRVRLAKLAYAKETFCLES